MTGELLLLLLLYVWWLTLLYVWACRRRVEREVEAICQGIASGCRKAFQGSEVAPAGGSEPAPADKV